MNDTISPTERAELESASRLFLPGWMVWAVSAAVAFALRLAYLLDIRLEIGFGTPVGEEAFFDFWARGGARFLYEGTSYLHAPLYPWVLSWIYDFNSGPMAARVIQVVIAAVTVGFVADLGRRVSGKLAGLAGGLLLAFAWTSIDSATRLTPATLAVALVTVAIWAITRAALEKRPIFAAVGAGLLGVASMAEPATLVFGLVPVLLAMGIPNSKGLSPTAPRSPALAIVCLVLVLLPGFALGIRNAKVGEGFVFLAHELSLDAYRGNHDGSDGSSHVLPGTRVAPLPAGDSALAYASQQAAQELNAGEAGAWYASAVWTQWREDLVGSVGRLFLKAGRLVGARERDGDRTLAWWRGQSPVLSLPIFTGWAVLFSLGLAGLFGLPRREDAAPVILSLVLFSVALLFLVVNERTRLPLAYLLAVTAGIPVARAIEALRARRFRAAVPLLLLAILLAGVSGIDRLVGVPDAKAVRAAGFVETGELLLRQRDWYQSLPWFRDAIADSEEQGEASSATSRAARLGMVRALMNTQRAEDADQHLAVLENLYPDDTEVLAMRGRYHLRRHDIKRAHPIFNEVLAQDPYRLEARLGLGWAQMENQAYRAALITFERARKLDMRNPELLAGIGAAALETTDNEGRAKRLMWRALGLDWRTYQAHQYLGSMARASRDIPVMLYHLRECLRLDPHNDGVRRFLTRTGAGLEHTPDVTRPPSPYAARDAD